VAFIGPNDLSTSMGYPGDPTQLVNVWTIVGGAMKNWVANTKG